MGAGDETRTRDIQLGRNVLGFEFGFSGNRRLSAFIQVFAIRRRFAVSRHALSSTARPRPEPG
jgi:hypothetical protein